MEEGFPRPHWPNWTVREAGVAPSLGPKRVLLALSSPVVESARPWPSRPVGVLPRPSQSTMAKGSGNERHAQFVLQLPVGHGAQDDLGFLMCLLVNDRCRVVNFVQCHVRTAGNVQQDAARAVNQGIFEQRAGEGHVSSLEGAMVASPDTGSHDGRAHALHDGPDVGKIEIDQARRDDQARNVFHRLSQHVVRQLERVAQRGTPAHDVQQPLVRDGDQRVHVASQGTKAFLGQRFSHPALELEGLW